MIWKLCENFLISVYVLNTFPLLLPSFSPPPPLYFMHLSLLKKNVRIRDYSGMPLTTRSLQKQLAVRSFTDWAVYYLITLSFSSRLQYF